MPAYASHGDATWGEEHLEWRDQVGISPDSACVDGVSSYRNIFGYKAFDGTSYDGRCAFFNEPALPEGIGWFIVVGLGIFFATLTTLMFWLSSRRAPQGCTTNTSEYFTSAGRTISAGLTAADVVSKWTWAATLLQSSHVAYKFGVSGPFWYAAGATCQVLLFSILALEIKRKCPAIHTVLEVVFVRWGTSAHTVFLFFCLGTNLIVTGMLILGGSAVVHALTGVNTVAACFLVPLGVFTYTAFGGLKATYYASWTHTTIIYLALLIFLWKVYVLSSDLGSTNQVWENLVLAAKRNPVEGNSNGSYLTLYSRSGFIFGIVNIVGNFGTVFVDQSYWQGAIACRPSATWKGYLLGGLAWFAIPFSMATTLGLAARALDLPITVSESSQGLLPPAVAVHLLGRGGAFLVALQLFLAVTSTANSEQLAVSSILAYDIYKMYFNSTASGKKLLRISRCGVLMWAVVSGLFAAVLHEGNISLDWLYKAMGNFIGSAVAPICMALLWKDCTANGAIAGAISGLVASLGGWIGMAGREGTVSVDTLGMDYPILTGNLLALCVSPLVAWAVSKHEGGQGFDWSKFDERSMHDPDAAVGHHTDDSEDSKQGLDRMHSTVVRLALGLSFTLVVAWPILTLPQDPFSRSYFAWWVALAFIWAHSATFVTVVYPIWEARNELMEAVGLQTASDDMDVRLDLVQSMSQPDSPPLPASASSAALSPALRAAAYAARMGLLGRPPPLRAGSSRSDHDGSHGGHNGYRDHGHSNSNHGHNSSHGHVHAPSQAGPGGGVTLGPASNSSSTGRCQSPPQSQLDPSPAERPAPLEASSPGPAGPTLGHWQATGSGGSPEARDPELDSEPVMGVAGIVLEPSRPVPMVLSTFPRASPSVLLSRDRACDPASGPGPLRSRLLPRTSLRGAA
mmetsp:Transcript_14234/g.33692  ORF Transcript_14234/g.33692 Transcript_14234/m.33692 type:complete len:910 (+) Transcript_14234:237-2966(+)